MTKFYGFFLKVFQRRSKKHIDMLYNEDRGDNVYNQDGGSQIL